ncbi:sensor histidine kinase [Streptomyces sp. NPDC050560]|uniref:sensor histidine kinase n=1 Tax=Streptomyces sp. NPDC050560 TaxID=3365630 RepID=UPI003798B003
MHEESGGGAGADRATYQDAGAAVLCCAAAVVPPALDGGAGAGGYALLAAGAAALVLHRLAPLAVLVFTTAAITLALFVDSPRSLAAVPVFVAVHLTAARTGRRALAAVAAVAFLTGSFVAGPHTAGRVEATVLLAGWFLCAVLTGLAGKNWRAYLRQTEERALEAERTREEAALRRAGEERLRIARELHDSLTHSISIVKLQAGVAVHLARKRGEEVPPALLAIQEAGSEAMRELRATLDVLREDGEPAGDPGQLVARARSAGIAAELKVTGGGRELPPRVSGAVYRIVQEALTNVARHAGRSAAVTVGIEHGGDTVTVSVEDDGRALPGPPPPPGTGLTGMRERVAALGGTLDTGPRPGGGFAVRAVLPVAAREAAR